MHDTSPCPTTSSRRSATRAIAVTVAACLLGVAGVVATAGADCSKVGPLADSARKFHPGHYVTIGRGEVRKGANVNAAAAKGVTGVQLRYRWSDLEPDRGRYELAPIERDLAAAKRAGLQLVAVIEDKSFDGVMPTPADLQRDHTMRGFRGFTAVRWDPVVRDRMDRLVAKLGAAFDCDPNFEGIAFQETALSVEPAEMQAHGYTPEKYRDAIVAQLRSATQSLPRSRVFWYMNFLPQKQQYLTEVADRVAGTGVVMGGPDILPDNQALQKRTYPLYQMFSHRMKMFGSMQNDSYRHARAGTPEAAVSNAEKPPGAGRNATTPPAAARSDDYWSMEELFVYGRDRLHLDYVFWEYRGQRRPTDVRDWTEAREVIARHPDFRRSG